MLTEKSINEFITDVSAGLPVPAGGSATALAGALASSLTAMVCVLTLGDSKYNDAHERIREIGDDAAEYTELLTRYIDEAEEVYKKVMTANKLPKTTEADKAVRAEAIQAATREAADLPLNVAKTCLHLLRMACQVLAMGSSNAASSAATGGLLAYAALWGALYNVKPNIKNLKDSEYVAETERAISEIEAQAEQLRNQLRILSSKVIG